MGGWWLKPSDYYDWISGHACAMCGALRYRVAPRTGRDYAIFMAEKVQNSDQDAPFKSALSSLCQKHTIRVGARLEVACLKL